MTGYLVRRLAALIPTLILVSMLAFGFTELAGGDPAREAAEKGDGELASDELVAELRSRWGLDEALPVRYVRWLADAAQGDLGESYLSGKPVADELLEKYPETLLLALTALILPRSWGFSWVCWWPSTAIPGWTTWDVSGPCPSQRFQVSGWDCC